MCACTALYLLDDGDLVVVADGVFAQEVELHHILFALQLLMEGDVLHTQRAAAHRVRRLPLLLLVTCSQCQLWGGRKQTEQTGLETRKSRPMQMHSQSKNKINK